MKQENITLPYLEWNLEELTKKTGIKLQDIQKNKHIRFQTFLTHLLLMDLEGTVISQDLLFLIFGSNYYKTIKQDIVNKKTGHGVNLNDYDNEDSKLFRYLFYRVYLGNSIEGKQSKYRLNLDMDELKDLLIKSKGLTFKEFLTVTHKNVNDVMTGLQRKKLDNYKRRVRDNEYIFTNNITIDKLHISKVIKDEVLNEQDTLKLKSILDTTKTKLKINYEIKDSGRHYSSIGLLKKDIRKHLLHGYTEYDISTSSPSYFYQVFQQISTNNELPNIDFYIKNKKLFREKLSSVIVGKEYSKLTTEEQKYYYSKSKEILTMIFFGSKINESTETEIYQSETFELDNVKFFETSIEKTLTHQEYNRFKNNKFVIDFLQEVSDMMKTISRFIQQEQYYDKVTRTLKINNRTFEFRNNRNTKDIKFYRDRVSFFRNQNDIKKVQQYQKELDVLLEMKLLEDKLKTDISSYKKKHIKEKLTNMNYKKFNSSQGLSFMYQSWESDFLLSMRDTYVKETQSTDYFLLHDGIYLKEDFDVRKLENSIQNTDFTVDVVLEITKL